jgi:hypothetical protein
MAERSEPTRPTAALVRWFLDQELLRGPFLFVDYWANVLGIHGIIPEAHRRDGHVDPALFRAGLDRPELEVPRLRYYLLFFLIGPFVFPFRAFRRMGRYRLRFLGERGEELLAALNRYRLELDPAPGGRVDVRRGTTTFARDLVDPRAISGFCSLFWAAYKLPAASLSAILLIAVLAPVLAGAGLLGLVLDYWIALGFPLLVLLLYAVYRDWVTALLGALPVILSRYLLAVFGAEGAWLPFFAALGALYLLYLLADWFFMPRPVPPALLLYTADGPGHPYVREGDAPAWLEGRAYWVWRYLILSPAEINKFWERDWERVDLWIRADGPDAGALEWVVTDLHYREVWIPYDRLLRPGQAARQRKAAIAAAQGGEAGTWLVEVDADIVFHYPFVRTVTWLGDRGDMPVQSVIHVLKALRRYPQDRLDDAHLLALDRIRMRTGRPVLGDVPEFVLRRVTRHILRQPWRYWRYPLGAATRWERRLYAEERPAPPPLAADPELQVKAGAPPPPPPAREDPGPLPPAPPRTAAD